MKYPERLEAVERMLRECQSHSVIEQILAARFGVTRGTVRLWIHEVYKQLGEQAEDLRPFAREKLREAFVEFYQRAMAPTATEKGPDYKAALQALDRLARLDGCYEPEKLVIDAGQGSYRTAEHVKSRMEELLQNPEILEKMKALGIKIG